MVQEQYANLPGVKVTYQDGNLYSGNQSLSANTKSMLIIGSAVDGPVGVPVSVTQLGVKSAEKLFGGLVDRKTKQPLPTSLVRGMYEAIKEGNEDIRLLRMDGRSARTELSAKDIASTTEQFIDYAAGNKAFAAPVNVPVNGKFVAINSVKEVAADGSQTVLNAASVIDYVDSSVAGSEKVYFFANKMRPGHTVSFDFDYETRNYTLVPKTKSDGTPDYTDPDYTLTRDTANQHYFYSARNNWSDQLISGHVPVVTVQSSAGTVYTIPSMNASGQFIYRVGNGKTADPLLDPWSADDYKTGGIFFTSAYDAEVSKGTYPAITGNVKVFVEYAWYTSYANSATTTASIPGTANTYDLNYTPMADGFTLYDVVNGVKTALTEGTDYSLSLVDKKVTINAGAAPVGAMIFADYQTLSSTSSDPFLIVEGKYPGSIYGRLDNMNDANTIYGVSCQVQIDPTDPSGEEKIITFFKPEEKRLTYKDTALVYYTKQLPRITTMRQFVNFVNNDASNNIVQLSCNNEFGQVAVRGLEPTTGPIYLGQVSPGVLKEDPTQSAGTLDRYPWLGSDGIFDNTSESDMQRLYKILGGTYDDSGTGDPVLVKQGIYQQLENYIVDQIVVLDVYANTVIDSLDNSECPKNFATQLAQHCAVVTAKTWEEIGFIGVAPAQKSDLLSIQNYIDDLTAAGQNEYYMYNEATQEYILDEDGEQIDIGRYVSVVFGPEVGLSNEKLGSYVSSGVIIYAAMVTGLNPEVATTNKAFTSVQGLRYTLSEAQHNQLVGGRYVTFDQKTPLGSNTTKFVVKDGVTGALATSDYTRLSTVRITHAAVQLVREAADPFIGQPNGLAQRNSLSAEVQASLDRLKELGVLQRFSFTIYSSVQDAVLGNAFITLELVPVFETRKFLTSVVLKAS